MIEQTEEIKMVGTLQICAHDAMRSRYLVVDTSKMAKVRLSYTRVGCQIFDENGDEVAL